MHSFVRRDLNLLRKHFDFRYVLYRNPRDFPAILRGTRWADITFSRFADVHAFPAVLLSRLLKKKSVVVVGGYEVAKIPELGYGLLLSPLKTLILRYILNRADRVLTVHEALKEEAVRAAGAAGRNIVTVYNGFDANDYSFRGAKEDIVLSVFFCSTWQRVRLKGLDTFIRTAKRLPRLRFVAIGIEDPVLSKLRAMAPPNVTFVPPVKENEIIPYFRKAKVYCQLSLREGFPNALCEAMLCECVPIGTDIPGIRTAIGDAGFLVPYDDPLATQAAIEKALASGLGKRARERIRRLFPLERREELFLDIIQGLIRR